MAHGEWWEDITVMSMENLARVYRERFYPEPQWSALKEKIRQLYKGNPDGSPDSEPKGANP